MRTAWKVGIIALFGGVALAQSPPQKERPTPVQPAPQRNVEPREPREATPQRTPAPTVRLTPQQDRVSAGPRATVTPPRSSRYVPRKTEPRPGDHRPHEPPPPPNSTK